MFWILRREGVIFSLCHHQHDTNNSPFPLNKYLDSCVRRWVTTHSLYETLSLTGTIVFSTSLQPFHAATSHICSNLVHATAHLLLWSYEVLWLLWMLIVYCILHLFLFTDKPCKACLVMNVSISNRTCNSFRKPSNKSLLVFNYNCFALNFFTINDKVILYYEKKIIVAHYDLLCLLRVFD